MIQRGRIRCGHKGYLAVKGSIVLIAGYDKKSDYMEFINSFSGKVNN